MYIVLYFLTYSLFECNMYTIKSQGDWEKGQMIFFILIS